MHHRSLAQAVDGLGQRVFVRVGHTADRGLQAGLGEPSCLRRDSVKMMALRAVPNT